MVLLEYLLIDSFRKIWYNFYKYIYIYKAVKKIIILFSIKSFEKYFLNQYL